MPKLGVWNSFVKTCYGPCGATSKTIGNKKEKNTKEVGSFLLNSKPSYMAR
jgi:hypothetical protein